MPKYENLDKEYIGQRKAAQDRIEVLINSGLFSDIMCNDFWLAITALENDIKRWNEQ